MYNVHKQVDIKKLYASWPGGQFASSHQLDAFSYTTAGLAYKYDHCLRVCYCTQCLTQVDPEFLLVWQELQSTVGTDQTHGHCACGICHPRQA